LDKKETATPAFAGVAVQWIFSNPLLQIQLTYGMQIGAAPPLRASAM